jgi:hypothetical protein
VDPFLLLLVASSFQPLPLTLQDLLSALGTRSNKFYFNTKKAQAWGRLGCWLGALWSQPRLQCCQLQTRFSPLWKAPSLASLPHPPVLGPTQDSGGLVQDDGSIWI